MKTLSICIIGVLFGYFVVGEWFLGRVCGIKPFRDKKDV